MNMLNSIAIASRLISGIAITKVVLVAAAVSADGRQLSEDKCAACHSLDTGKATLQSVQEKIQRKGPPLHYAGQKYQQPWLEKWLQAPVRITPSGGDYWANAVVVTDEGDEIEPSKLIAHIALDIAEAKAVSRYLGSLKPYPNLVEESTYKPKKVNSMLAKKDFRKFKGCSSCHRDKTDFGGVSAPELYTAMNRLQLGFIASYIKDPLAWDPHSLMPNQELNDVSINKLMNYLNLIKIEEEAE